MKVNLESTTKTVTLNGIEARIWEGHTESGIRVHAYISRIAVKDKEDCREFEAELQKHQPPSAEIAAIPLRLVL